MRYKEIPGGPYIISRGGAVFSTKTHDRISPYWYGNKGGSYPGVKLIINGTRKWKYIHRLVAEIFIPNDNPEKTEVNHIRKDKTDTRDISLEWVTPEENRLHKNEFISPEEAAEYY
jgi:hypothetical protein